MPEMEEHNTSTNTVLCSVGGFKIISVLFAEDSYVLSSNLWIDQSYNRSVIMNHGNSKNLVYEEYWKNVSSTSISSELI